MSNKITDKDTATTQPTGFFVNLAGAVRQLTWAGFRALLDALYAPISHTHAIGDTGGLQAALDAKAAASHSHNAAEVSGAADTELSNLDSVPAARSNLGLSSGATMDIASQAAAEAGTESTTIMTPRRTKQAITAQAAPVSHTHTLAQVDQSGATSGQVATWNGTEWVPTTPSGGGAAISLPLRAWVESTGHDGTGAVGNPAKPYLTMQAAYTAGARELYLGEGTFAGITKAGSIDVRLMGHGKSKTSVTLLKSTDGGDVSVQDLGVWSLSIMTLTTERAALTTPGASGLAMGSLGLHNVYIVGNVAGIGQDGIAGGAGGAYPGGNGGNGANLTVFGRVFIGGTLDVFGGLGGAAGDDGDSSDQNGGAGGSSGNIIVVGSLRVVGVVNAYGAGGGAPFLSGTAGAAGSGSNIDADEIVCDATLFLGTGDSTGSAGTLASRKAYINVAEFSGSISSLGSISGACIVIGTLGGAPETTYALLSHINGAPVNT